MCILFRINMLEFNGKNKSRLGLEIIYNIWSLKFRALFVGFGVCFVFESTYVASVDQDIVV